MRLGRCSTSSRSRHRGRPPSRAPKPAIEAKHIRLEIDLDPRAGQVLGDATRLQQIVWNLLSNSHQVHRPRGRDQRPGGALRGERGDRRIRQRARHWLGFFALRLRPLSASGRQLCTTLRRAWPKGSPSRAIWSSYTVARSRSRARAAGRGSTFTVRLPFAGSRNAMASWASNREHA